MGLCGSRFLCGQLRPGLSVSSYLITMEEGFLFPLPPTHLCIGSSAGEGRLVVKIPLSLEPRYRFRDLGPLDERFLVSKLVVFGIESTAVARVLFRNGRVVCALAFKSPIETVRWQVRYLKTDLILA